MKKEEYLKIANKYYDADAFKLVSKQIEFFFAHINDKCRSNNYKVGDFVNTRYQLIIHYI